MKPATKCIEPAVVYTLTATCVGGAHLETECVRVLEISDDQTLLELHYAILDAIQFDDDHMHEFYVARTERSRPRFSLTDPEGNYEYVPEVMRRKRSFDRRFGIPSRPVEAKVEAAAAWAMRLVEMEGPPLNRVFPLPERLKLFFWFDFGDDWKFEIKKDRSTHPPAPKTRYPRVVQRVGPNPKQYPNWDE